MSNPDWYIEAEKEIGNRETGNNAGPYIKQLISQARCGSIGDPWCAIFINAMLEMCGHRGTRSASSQSFRHDANFIPLAGPARGAIAVFWRITQSSGLGHVCLYDGEDAHGFICGLGGNEGDMVQREMFNPAGKTFGLRGYYWPKGVPLPIIGKVPLIKIASGKSSKVV